MNYVRNEFISQPIISIFRKIFDVSAVKSYSNLDIYKNNRLLINLCLIK